MKKILMSVIVVIAAATFNNVALAGPVGFGSIPGVSPGSNPFSGNGIPYDSSVFTQYTGPAGAARADVLTMALSVTAHGSLNPAPSNNGIDTYYVSPGLVNGRSTWNFDYYLNTLNNSSLGVYSFIMTITGPNGSFSFDPTLIPDNVGGPKSAGNSESLDFAFLSSAIGGYDPYANATYYVDLSGTPNDNLGPMTTIGAKVVVGTGGGHVPDTGSTLAMFSTCMGGLILVGKRRFKTSKA